MATPTLLAEHVGPPELFHCVLDNQPDYLVPKPMRTGARSERRVNPAVGWTAPDDLPPAFWAGFPLAWAPGMLAPFSVSPALKMAIETGQPIPERQVCALQDAGILIGSAGPPPEPVPLDEKGYLPLTGLIHRFHIGALRRYYRQLMRTGRLRLGDRQSPKRYVAHNEPVASFFHRQLADRVGDSVGKAVKPSYVYLAGYQSGAALPRHLDRAQCEYSLTMLIDFTPEPDGLSPWPLILETASGRVEVHQAIGDALLYRGRTIPHSRDPLPEGMTSTSIFFHYVDADFTGPLA